MGWKYKKGDVLQIVADGEQGDDPLIKIGTKVRIVGTTTNGYHNQSRGRSLQNWWYGSRGRYLVKRVDSNADTTLAVRVGQLAKFPKTKAETDADKLVNILRAKEDEADKLSKKLTKFSELIESLSDEVDDISYELSQSREAVKDAADDITKRTTELQKLTDKIEKLSKILEA